MDDGYNPITAIKLKIPNTVLTANEQQITAVESCSHFLLTQSFTLSKSQHLKDRLLIHGLY